METSDFSYHRPATLAEASELGSKFGAQARYLAGGTELLIDFRNGRDSARHLISLKDISGLDSITRDPDGQLRIGAMTTLAAIAASPAVRECFPALAEGALTMAGAQVRNQATIGGNFCRAVSCADTPPICMVGEARLKVVDSATEKLIPIEGFFTGPRQTTLRAGEILVEIRIPPQPANSGASYQRFSLRRGQALAVAAVAARVSLRGTKLDGARVALGAVAPTPMRAHRCEALLQGKAPSDELFARAAAAAAAESRPISDLRGTEVFRREMVEVLTVRALREATERARERRA